MNKSELRLGNWVWDSNEGMSQIGCIDTRTKNVGLANPLGGSHDGTEIEFISPIVLTEEWLVEFGFNNGGDRAFLSWFKGPFIPLSKTPASFMFYIGGVDHHIHYVHELQNLYFALMREELCVKF